MKHVLAPIDPPYRPEVAAALESYPKRDGRLISLFRVFANSARFVTDKGVVNLLDANSPLTLREREIVILRVCANLDCEYEWGVHVAAFAKAAGLTDTQTEATRTGDVDEPCWTPEDSLLVGIVDELCDRACIAAATYSKFQSAWSLEAQLEILALVGNYHTISFIANTTRLEGEPFGARFPGDNARRQDRAAFDNLSSLWDGGSGDGDAGLVGTRREAGVRGGNVRVHRRTVPRDA